MQWTLLLHPGRMKAGGIVHSVSEIIRSDYDRDYDRIIFSRPFRRLQDKTQVFPLPDEGFVHNRLTHSLEVASVARTLGRRAGLTLIQRHPELTAGPHDIGAIVSAAALCHDIGNPPFGHSGEEALSDFFQHHPDAKGFRAFMNEEEWTDLCRFEGNAQGFRLLVREEEKGLQLSLATLAAFTKYPKNASAPSEKGRKSQKKFGYFQSESTYFQSLAEACGMSPLGQGFLRHPLAFLVEAADDICYHLMDLEDGFTLGLVDFETTRGLMAELLGETYDAARLGSYTSNHERIGVLRAMGISKLIQACVEVFLDEEKAIREGAFDQALTDTIALSPTLKHIQQISINQIYRSKPVLAREASGFEILSKLIERFSLAVFRKHFASDHLHGRDRTIYRLLPEVTRISLEQQKEPSLYNSLRLVIDAVSGLTDKEAQMQFRAIHGIPLA
jgi:dGTPase